MTSLRERREDIRCSSSTHRSLRTKAGKTIRRVNKRTLDRCSRILPGNVRELQNVIERSVILCDTDEFTVDDSWRVRRAAVESRLACRHARGHEKTIIGPLRASGGRVFGPSGAADGSALRARRSNRKSVPSESIRTVSDAPGEAVIPPSVVRHFTIWRMPHVNESQPLRFRV